MSYQRKIGKYKIEKLLGHGGYGQVYLSYNDKKQEKVAVKLSQDKKDLIKEYRILKHFSKLNGFMKVHEYGHTQGGDYFVSEVLGENLSYNYNDKILSLECVCAIGLELLDRLEKVHENDIIHRDIKPSQFLRSANKKSIILIDFGMSCFFRVNGLHKKFKTRCKRRGTISYASINNHLGFRQSRRDDLESLCYSLLYLVKGELPWKFETDIESFMKWKIVLNQKINVTNKELFGDLPIEFSVLLKYTRTLIYDQNPNYGYMKSLLEKFVDRENIWHYFDWIELPDKHKKRKNSQIVEGATVMTKLKREKKIFKSRSNKHKKSTKIMFKSRYIVKEKLLGLDVSEIYDYEKSDLNNLSTIKCDYTKGNLDTKRNFEVSDSEDCHIQIYNHKSIIKHDLKHMKYKKKKTTKLYKILSSSDIGKIEEHESYIISNKNSSKYLLPIVPNNLHENSNECITPRLELPEFKNRESIFKARSIFAVEFKNMVENFLHLDFIRNSKKRKILNSKKYLS
ncbi:hypothetical protein SteCoe_20637 [Stentor coeruleus]|uniref:Casein kinase I n=1 Tax=Stentor coeruleus TaxID=5963 RepID=A0A1R2BRY9_9CILI|nr:hypothetical protein SteCoe_20637 [Stentor coeruleus]